jgi:hypothetical protein
MRIGPGVARLGRLRHGSARHCMARSGKAWARERSDPLLSCFKADP